ncbi:MAG: Txe/YoeB family addiction module toxin [Treponemataceae bacterium]|nr:Txe/YoeB family addiction module toxin [Treponemataceae bacterium]
MWEIVYAKQAVKDSRKIKECGLKSKVTELLAILSANPFQNPPPYEKLVGDLSGFYSRRITIQYRLYENEKIVQVLRMWTYYE